MTKDAGAVVGEVIAAPVISSVVPGDGKNVVTWPAVAGATAYDLFWGTSATLSKYSEKIVGVNSPYSHTGLSNGTTYYYVVVAQDAETESVISNEMSGTPVAPPPPITPPTPLVSDSPGLWPNIVASVRVVPSVEAEVNIDHV